MHRAAQHWLIDWGLMLKNIVTDEDEVRFNTTFEKVRKKYFMNYFSSQLLCRMKSIGQAKLLEIVLHLKRGHRKRKRQGKKQKWSNIVNMGQIIFNPTWRLCGYIMCHSKTLPNFSSPSEKLILSLTISYTQRGMKPFVRLWRIVSWDKTRWDAAPRFPPTQYNLTNESGKSSTGTEWQKAKRTIRECGIHIFLDPSTQCLC